MLVRKDESTEKWSVPTFPKETSDQIVRRIRGTSDNVEQRMVINILWNYNQLQ